MIGAPATVVEFFTKCKIKVYILLVTEVLFLSILLNMGFKILGVA